MKRAADAFAVALACVGAFACTRGLLPEVAAEDPCAVEMARLEGLRNAEIAAACYGQAFDECAAVDRVNAKYDPLIQEQVRCGNDR